MAATARLRLSKSEAERLHAASAGDPPVPDRLAPAALRAFAYRVGVTAAVDRLLLARAGSGNAADPADAAAIRALADWHPPAFPVAGKDLIDAGISPGPEVGLILRRLEAWWIGEDFAPDRHALLSRLREFVA